MEDVAKEIERRAEERVLAWQERMSDIAYDFVPVIPIVEDDEDGAAQAHPADVEEDQGSHPPSKEEERRIQNQHFEQVLQKKLLSALNGIGDLSELPPKLRKELAKRICGALGVLDFQGDVTKAAVELKKEKTQAKLERDSRGTQPQRKPEPKAHVAPQKNPYTQEKRAAFEEMKAAQRELGKSKLPESHPALVKFLDAQAMALAWAKKNDPIAFRQHEKAAQPEPAGAEDGDQKGAK
jgi:hypothetical protein